MSETLMQRLIQQEKGMVFLSAPTQSGKTHLVKAVRTRRPYAVIISAEQFAEAILRCIQSDGQTDPFDELSAYACVCIEDIDWYSGKPQIQYEMAAVMSRLSENVTVIATGIALKKRMEPMFSKLTDYDLFEKTKPDGEWEQAYAF